MDLSKSSVKYKKLSLFYRKICSIFLLVYISLFSSLALTFNEAGSDFWLELTEQERQWLKNNSTVIFTGDPDWLPYEAFDKSGNYIGIVADHLKLVEKITGLQFLKTEVKTWPEAVELADSGKVDMITAVTTHPKISKSFSHVTPFLKNNISVIMKKSAPAIEDLNDIITKRIGVIEGYGYIEEIEKAYPSIKLILVENPQVGLEKVSNEQLDALIISKSQGLYAIPLLGYDDVKFVGSSGISIEITFFISKEMPLLQGIVDKAIKTIHPSEQKEITSHWIASEKVSDFELNLTLSERTYLNSIAPIKFTGDPNWLPYESFDERGVYSGQVAEHLTLIEQLLGVEIQRVPSTSWEEAVEMARQGRVDILSETEDSVISEQMLMSRTYSHSPMVIVTREEEYFISGIDQLKNKRLAMVKDYGNTLKIKEEYSYIQFIEVETIQEGLLDVSSGKIDALIGNSAQAIFNIKKLGIENVKIAGKTEFETRLAFAINPEKEPLVDIFDKALDIIYLSAEQQKIYDKWSNVELVDKADYQLFYKTLLLASLIVLVGVFWLRHLKKDIARRKKIAKELTKAKEQANVANEAKSRFLAVMSHELRTPLNGILGMLELVEHSELDTKQRSTIKIAKESSDNLLNILNDILDFSKIEANKMDILIADKNIKDLIETCVNSQIQNIYEKDLAVELFIDPELNAKYEIDSARIRQIINNFINNAVKFTEKGKISILAEVISKEANQCDFSISVRDTGIGITKNNQELLFKEFVQVDMDNQRKYGGSGLGLSICKRLANLLGGKITLESQSGVGTTITYLQNAKLSNKQKNNRYKWSGTNVVLDTKDNFVESMLIQYLGFFDANIVRGSIDDHSVPSYKKWCQEKKANILIIDREQYLANAEELSKLQEQPSFSIIQLVKEKNLSSSNFIANMGTLNINPLLPHSFELLIDLSLGLEKRMDIQPPLEAYEENKSSIRLLVVEDHPTNRELIHSQLTLLGYSFVVAGNGQEAIDEWKKQSFDGVLTDCHMPGMDGYEMTRRMRVMGAISQPIIAMTANALEGERKKCISSGMNDILVKPISISQLSASLKQWFPEANELMGSEISIKKRIKKLEEIFNGRENVEPMIKSYLKATEKDLIELKLAVNGKNRQEIKQIAHRIKGAAKIIQEKVLIDLTEKIERNAYKEDIGYIDKLVNEFEKSVIIYRDSVLTKI